MTRIFKTCLIGLSMTLGVEFCHGAEPELIWNRDPFVLPQTQDRSPTSVVIVKCPSQLKLQGLMPGDNPQVFMNDGVYELGDRINGYSLIRITADSVILKIKSEQCVLKSNQGV